MFISIKECVLAVFCFLIANEKHISLSLCYRPAEPFFSCFRPLNKQLNWSRPVTPFTF